MRILVKKIIDSFKEVREHEEAIAEDSKEIVSEIAELMNIKNTEIKITVEPDSLLINVWSDKELIISSELLRLLDSLSKDYSFIIDSEITEKAVIHRGKVMPWTKPTPPQMSDFKCGCKHKLTIMIPQ